MFHLQFRRFSGSRSRYGWLVQFSLMIVLLITTVVITATAAAATEKTLPVTVGTARQTADQEEPDDEQANLAGGEQSGSDLVEITANDMSKCTNCKTCYQDLGELFEKTKIMVDGSSKEVSRVIPGIFDKIEITPELVKRASRVADECDAEIIRVHKPNK